MTSKRLPIFNDEPEFGWFLSKVAEGMDFKVRVTTQPRRFLAGAKATRGRRYFKRSFGCPRAPARPRN